MPDVDPYGFFASDENEPRKKRTRSKPPRAVAASHATADDDDEQDASATDPYGFGHLDEPGEPDASPDMTRGPPPGAAGTPSGAPSQRAWYDELSDSATSFAQGALANFGDEAIAGTIAATDYAGLTHSGNTYRENQQQLEQSAKRVTDAYPVGHGAGQMAAGLAASVALPGSGLAGYAAQGAAQGALSGLSEYGDSGKLGSSLGAAAAGAASGVAGTYLGGKAARLFATSPKAAQEAQLLAIERASASKPSAPPAAWPPGRPADLPVPDSVPRPQALPPGGPAGAAPAPPAAPARPNFYRGELDMTPPPQTPVPAAPEPAYTPPGGDWTAEFAQPPRAPSLPEASERELQQVALSRARAEMQPSKMSGALRGASTLAAIGGHPALGAGLRAGSALLAPTERAGALASGYLKPNPAAATATRMGFEGLSELVPPAIAGGKVNAQDRDEKVAYADQATVNYALTETLHGGNTGLSQADEQALTSAVVKGDDDAIRATDFRLRQRYPGYARRVERALRNLNEDD